MSESKSILKKRPYHHIDDQVREELVNQIEKLYGKMEVTIRSIAESLHINYSTAKTILSTYRKEGRIKKKKSKERNRSKSSRKTINSELLTMLDFTRYNREVVNSFARRKMFNST